MNDAQIASLRRRSDQLSKDIDELERLLADSGDGGWCLGDPYEALESMKREAADIDNRIELEFNNR